MWRCRSARPYGSSRRRRVRLAATRSVVICGGGVVGLCTAMMLARDGVDVTLFEADPAEPPAPGDAWTSWTRKGVAQFRQPHNLFGRFREICDDELPGLTDKLLAAGCVWVDFLASLPPGIGDRAPRPDDERLRFVTGRRPVVESVLAEAARGEPGVTVRRGTRVAGLVQGTAAISGTPHVIGVRSSDGEEIHADLVVDAMGRRSPPRVARRARRDASRHRGSEDCGYAYYTRYFTGPTRPKRSWRAGQRHTAASPVLTLYGDNDTWSVTLLGMRRRSTAQELRDPEPFRPVVQASRSRALARRRTDHRVLADGRHPRPVPALRRRRRVRSSRAIAAVGDAWACTNPSAGRGISVGMIHAQRLRKESARDSKIPTGSRRVGRRHRGGVAAVLWHQLATDRARLDEMNAIRQGVEPPSQSGPMTRLVVAAGTDADAFRALIETVQCLALPQDVFKRPGMIETLEWHGRGQPASAPGPDREQLLSLLA